MRKAGRTRAMVLHKDDNVATALVDLEQSEKVEIQRGEERIEVILLDPIPFGHKFSLKDLSPGARVLKYGNCIGLAFAQIWTGHHVHLHNLKSSRIKAAEHGSPGPENSGATQSCR